MAVTEGQDSITVWYLSTFWPMETLETLLLVNPLLPRGAVIDQWILGKGWIKIIFKEVFQLPLHLICESIYKKKETNIQSSTSLIDACLEKKTKLAKIIRWLRILYDDLRQKVSVLKERWGIFISRVHCWRLAWRTMTGNVPLTKWMCNLP